MSQKTDSPEFAPGFLWQITFLTIAALCLVLLSRADFGWNLSKGPRVTITENGARGSVSYPISIFPWMIGGKQTLENGLRAFTGKPLEGPRIADRTKALVPILISMVLCPTVFFLAWRRRQLVKASQPERPPLRISSPFYALCGLVIVFISLAVGPIAYISEKSRVNLRHAQSVQGNRDNMINELNTLAFDAAQYYILPTSLGAGGRSFKGYSVSEKLAKSEEASYTVTGSKNEVTFHATSTKYPSCTIDVKVDSVGHMAGWVYEGEFK